MCYRLDGNSNSVNKEFFDQGNEMQSLKYGGQYPWVSGSKHTTQIIEPIVIGPGISIV